MENSERAPNPALSGRNAPTPEQAAHIEGSRVVSADYGMPGTKGMAKPFVPLLWLLIPFFFCLAYGIMTR
ncbi:MAG TPA: hypothetical protein VKP30_14200 [Polyangiaceae bacterium]|nr:hypothetical protein [Polyangiaceae bacterium]